MKSYLKISFILFVFSFSQIISPLTVVANTENLLVNDSLQLIGKTKNPLTDNQPIAKISLPGKNMVKRADNEMHRNMKSDLAANILFNYIDTEITKADNTITNEFYKSFQLSYGTDLKKADSSIDYAFKAENINFNLFFNLEEIDNQMNKRFYSSKY